MSDLKYAPLTNPAAQLLKLWPTYRELAADIEQKEVTVKFWAMRGSIPSHAWRRLVSASRARGLGVTLEILATQAEQHEQVAKRSRRSGSVTLANAS